MNLKIPIIFESIFIIIALIVYGITSNPFFIVNFLYIGTSLSVGLAIMNKNHRYGRNVIMIAIGSYLFFYVGIFQHENISMSGFWYYLFLGVFEAAVVHFLVAKILGTLLFGRGGAVMHAGQL